MSIQVDIYKVEKKLPQELVVILFEKYGHQVDYDFFINDYIKSYLFCVDNPNIDFHAFFITDNGIRIGHSALIIDHRLPNDEAFFGFLEFPNDQIAFDHLWLKIKEFAINKGIKTIKGPVNGSIWHQYRVVKETDDSSFFKSELFCERYYYDYLLNVKPSDEIGYHSAYRQPFDVVLDMIPEEEFIKIFKYGFSIKELNQISLLDLKKIAGISKIIFSKSWGYTELNAQEFMDLYSSDKLEKHLNSLYLLYKGEEIIGFCSTSEENKDTIICKTICILPEYQGLGLGNAIAYKVHLDAKKNGYKKIIYALIRETNNIKNFPKDGTVIFRKYSAFDYKI